VDYFFLGIGIYELFRLIKAFIEHIKDMIAQQRFVENKFYFVMGIVSIILPFVLLYKYGINSEIKCLCVMAPLWYVLFTIESWGFKINFFDVFKGKVRDEDKIGLSSEALEEIEKIDKKLMKVFSKYSKEKNGYMIMFIIYLIFSIITICLTLYLDIVVDDVGLVLIMTIGGLIMLRILKPFLTLAGSAKFDIKFYKDRFEYKGMIKQKVVKYNEVESITELLIDIPRNYGSKIDLRVLEIKLKSKKKNDRIYIALGGLKEENRGRLEMDCKRFFTKQINRKSKFILFF
jgi:hypothetical protein